MRMYLYGAQAVKEKARRKAAASRIEKMVKALAAARKKGELVPAAEVPRLLGLDRTVAHKAAKRGDLEIVVVAGVRLARVASVEKYNAERAYAG